MIGQVLHVDESGECFGWVDVCGVVRRVHARSLLESFWGGYGERCSDKKHCTDPVDCDYQKSCVRKKQPRLEYLCAIPLSAVMLVACFGCQCLQRRMGGRSQVGNSASCRQAESESALSVDVGQLSGELDASVSGSAGTSSKRTADSCSDENQNSNWSVEVLRNAHPPLSATLPESKYAILDL